MVVGTVKWVVAAGRPSSPASVAAANPFSYPAVTASVACCWCCTAAKLLAAVKLCVAVRLLPLTRAAELCAARAAATALVLVLVAAVPLVSCVAQPAAAVTDAGTVAALAAVPSK